MKRILLIAAALGIVIGAAAQTGDKKCNCEKKEKQSPEQMVQKRVDRMASELQLSDTQVEPLNKLSPSRVFAIFSILRLRADASMMSL